jgi:hypothetical protein
MPLDPTVDLATKIQPNPTGNGVDIAVEAALALRSMQLDSLADDIEARIRMGEKKYGSRLRAFNGRDVFTDLGQEMLDAINYAKQAQLEGKDDGSLFKLIVAVTVLVEKRWKSLDSYQEKELWTSLLRSIDEILKTK